MRILTVAPEKYERHRDFLRQMHRLRATVFGGRLAWDVSIAAGEERDQYDECRPTYLLAIADGGKVAGCVRLLPASGPTMLEQTFPQLLDAGSLRPHAGWSRVHASASIRPCPREGEGASSILRRSPCLPVSSNGRWRAAKARLSPRRATLAAVAVSACKLTIYRVV